MHQRISKKIFIYLLIFFILVTVNNINVSKFDLFKIKNLKIFGLEKVENDKFYKNIEYLKNKNIFFLDKKEISDNINSNKIVDEFFVFKNYPFEIKVEIKKTKFIALTKKNQQNYFIGSNGNLIRSDNSENNLPFVFGKIDVKNFLKIKNIIDNSDFNFDEIKNFYYFKSKRWDLETNEGLVIKLPLKGIEPSLNILTNLYKKKEYKDMKIIDFRQNKQIIINE